MDTLSTAHANQAMQRQRAVADASHAPIVPAVELRGFSFGYGEGDGLIVGPVDWTLESGAFAMLVGPTGCGKTTLLRNLKPELRPIGHRAGDARLFGVCVDDMDAESSARTVGYVAQSPENQIVCDTVWHELAFGLENLGTPTDEMRRRVAEVVHFFGIEPWLDRATDELSGGQKQLMNLAGVLAMRPRILLLDEPTSQLDPVASKNFLHALFRVNRELGLTIIVVTHEPETLADYITDMAELHDGRIVVRDATAYAQEVHGRAASVDYNAPGICAPVRQGGERVARMRDVYCRYARELPFVLKGCDFDLHGGAIHAIVGGNGSGKSTLLSVLAGSMRLDRGRMENLRRASQALLPQNPKTIFMCDTVAEELREWQRSAGYAQEDVARMARRFRLGRLMDQHPYDLSGGQQQLLACAKILLTRPHLLLLDEPTKGLDVLSKYLVADALCEAAAQGATILLVTHDLSFAARVADTTSMLFDGQIVCTQPTGAFFAENLFYRPVVDWFFATWERPEIVAEKVAAGEALPWLDGADADEVSSEVACKARILSQEKAGE